MVGHLPVLYLQYHTSGCCDLERSLASSGSRETFCWHETIIVIIIIIIIIISEQVPLRNLCDKSGRNRAVLRWDQTGCGTINERMEERKNERRFKTGGLRAHTDPYEPQKAIRNDALRGCPQ